MPISLKKAIVDVVPFSKAMQSSAHITSSKATYLPPFAFILEVTAPRPVCNTGDDMDPGEERW